MIITHFLASLLWLSACSGRPASGTGNTPPESDSTEQRVLTGAEVLVAEKMNLLKGRKVAIVANQTSLLNGETHLVDTLKSLGVDIKRVFAPEHGFRGDHDAGKHVSNSKDIRTGLPVVSLYGSNKKPTPAQLADVDLVIFDIQDVGARFYTYISTLAYVMEACAEQKKTLMVLDRPNPNGWYVEGPVLQEGYQSFVGLHKIPTVHGMTVGEYATMVNQEGWLKGGAKCLLEVVTCKGYKHAMKWEETGLPWIAPSPNLTTEYSAYLYPMLCWFEGMAASVGRGTDHPFEVLAAPWHKGYHYQIRRDSAMGNETPSGFQYYGLEASYIQFTPRAIAGKSSNPEYLGRPCYGAKFQNRVDGRSLFMAGIALAKNLEEESHNVKLAEPLYKESLSLLMGSNAFETMVKAQKTEEEIYQSWQPEVDRFKIMRKKHLLYPDFN